MLTGNDVFAAAMALSDNLKNGLADNSDTADYKDRAVMLINMLGQDLFQYSDTVTAVAGLRPVFPRVAAMTEPIALDDGLALGVMPHGLVALLLSDENAALANYHEQKYTEKKAHLKIPNAWQPIDDLYGINDYSESGE